MWSLDTSNEVLWKAATVFIPKQHFMFEVAKIVLIVSGNRQTADLGFDNLQVGQGSCDHYSRDICPQNGTYHGNVCLQCNSSF